MYESYYCLSRVEYKSDSFNISRYQPHFLWKYIYSLTSTCNIHVCHIYLVFTLVFSPMTLSEIQIINLFILYKPQTVLSILEFIWNRSSLYVIVLCPCSTTRANTRVNPSLASLRSSSASISHKRFYLLLLIHRTRKIPISVDFWLMTIHTSTCKFIL